MLKFTIESDPKEIADLVLALQGQRNHEYEPIGIIHQVVQQSIDDIEPKKPL